VARLPESNKDKVKTTFISAEKGGNPSRLVNNIRLKVSAFSVFIRKQKCRKSYGSDL